MNMDLLKFQKTVTLASEVYIDEMSQNAGIMAVAINDPSKLKEVLPKRTNENNSEGQNDFSKFQKDFGSF